MPDSLEKKRSPLILVVDDDKATRSTLNRILKANGYQTLFAAGGEEALDLYRQRVPDMVLLDMVMPGVNGVEVCRQIRSGGMREAMPVVMLTENNDREAIRQAFDAGATDFMTKPINWSLLAHRIAYAMRGSEMYRMLETSQQQLKEAQRIARMGYWTLDVANNLVHMSEGANELLGLEASRHSFALDELMGHVHKDDLERVASALSLTMVVGEPYKLEHRVRMRNGREAIVVQQGDLKKDKEYPAGRVIGTIQDVTELHQARAELEYHTNFDPLTDLPNRRSFELQVSRMLVDQPTDSLFAVVFAGLDHLSQINDSLGHSGGDRVLQAVAARLCEMEAEGHFVSRFGGDVFTLLLKNLHHVNECDALVARMLQRINDVIEVAEHKIYITASIGVSLFPLESEDSVELIKGAEAAMLRSKEAGGNRMTYRTAEMSAGAQRRLAMEKAMRQGIERGEFVVYYQPQVDASSLKTTGMEALVRWQHPEQGLVRPDLFIPLAEETGMVVPIGEQVLREACRQTRRWWDMGFQLCCSVNVSAEQFSRDDLIPSICAALDEAGLPAQALGVEVTESMSMNDFDVAVDKLQQLRDMGVKTSMDDFGTGYSSLSYLQRLPLDTLKVDQAFVRNIQEEDDGADGENGAIATAVVAMAHSLGLNVIAEGVETDYQYQFLCRQGSEVMQGYLFGRPMCAADFEEHLTSDSRRASQPEDSVLEMKR